MRHLVRLRIEFAVRQTSVFANHRLCFRLRGRLPLGAGLSLDGRIENLLDREYSIIDTYTTPGMTALLTLRWDGSGR